MVIESFILPDFPTFHKTRRKCQKQQNVL